MFSLGAGDAPFSPGALRCVLYNHFSPVDRVKAKSGGVWQRLRVTLGATLSASLGQSLENGMGANADD